MLFIKNKKAFTLIEILIGILLVSTVMVSAFQALSSLWIWKIKLIENTQTQKQALYFSEKLFEMIKYGGTIDYEEYFARDVRNNYIPVSSVYWTQYLSGHYEQSTWYGNFWPSALTSIWSNLYKVPPIPSNSAEFYYCESPDWWPSMWSGWCYSSYAATWSPQAYGQYSFQFIDYNSDMDNDWDEDGDWDEKGDDDDEFLWEWPEVFAAGSDVKELYLINGVKRERIFFRYNVTLDQSHPQYPNPSICTTWDLWSTYTWSGCLWNIEYLKLEGRDWWMDHVDGSADDTEYDWVIDTWIISHDFTGWVDIVAGTDPDKDKYWQKLFPEDINVTEFKVFPHPNIDISRAWKVDNPSRNVAEYVRIQLWMMPAWKNRKQYRGKAKEYKVITTINLTDIFSR